MKFWKFSRLHYVRNLDYCIMKDSLMYGYHVILLGHFVDLYMWLG